MQAEPLGGNESDNYLYSKGHAWYVLFLIFVLMCFDFIDRAILSSLLPFIKEEWKLSDTQLGVMVGVVNVAIALFVYPTSILVDRWSRTKSISYMAIIWSIATGACALAGNFTHLLIGRFFIGAGEAGYQSGGASLLSAIFPKRLRATVMGISQSASMIGSVLGVVLGGYIASKWGWRYAFGVVALPGLVFAILILFVRDYQTVKVEVKQHAGDLTSTMSWQEITGVILKSPALRPLFLGSAMQLMFVATMTTWLPSFISRYQGIAVSQAGLRTGLMLLAASLGVAAFGFMSDKLVGGEPRRRLYLMSAFALGTSVMFVAAFLTGSVQTQTVLMFAGAFLMVAILGPCYAVIHDLVHPGMRGMAVGAFVLINNIVGMAVGPVLTGFLADRFELNTALHLVSYIPLISAVAFFIAATRYDRAISELKNI